MMSPARCRLQPLQAVHDGVGQRLAGVGVLLDELGDAYRQAAGIVPPNTCCVPLRVRVSLMIFTSPFCSSMVITGSVLLIASICP
jgi:hypothetical protein